MPRSSVFQVAIPVAAVCAGLGVWQLSRLGQRRAQNAELGVAMAERTFTGRFDYARQIVVVARVMRGSPAVIIVTPLILADSTAVLVERGWLASPDAYTVELGALGEGDTAEVRGIAVDPGPMVPVPNGRWPKHLQRATPKSLAVAYPYRLRTELLRRTNVELPLQAVPPPDVTEGPHLAYAVQWFSFAVIVLIGSIFLNRRGEK